MSESLVCDVAVIGGGMGGVAAALAAAESGQRVVLAEATCWLGGQMTSQGVSALDEHEHIETFGGTRAYYHLRNAIRACYRKRYGAPATMPGSHGQTPLNPGNGWVSRLCFEPRVGLRVIEEMLAPQIGAGRLRVLTGCEPIAATVVGDTVTELCLGAGDGEVRVRAPYYLDATEWGDLLPLAGVEHVTGAEAHADTGEADAPTDGAHPGEVQSFTYTFAVRHLPGEDHVIAKPAGYERFRDEQPYTLTLQNPVGQPEPYRVFATGPTGLPPFWTYRRIFDGALLDPGGPTADVAMINWPGNDYRWGDVLSASPIERLSILDEAKRLALGFLYWLQTEAPRDDDSGRGYPGLQLLPEVMGSEDGLSLHPYVRESRRIVALKRIVAEDILAAGRQRGSTTHFGDTCGIGWYPMDLHPSVGNPSTMFAPTVPFQIPLGALIPIRVRNLLAACKNIGATHLSNGSYRLHPVEWNIGEAAGALAAFCVDGGCAPPQVWATPGLLLAFQERLRARGVPLEWPHQLLARE
jgi:hypothetical protein